MALAKVYDSSAFVRSCVISPSIQYSWGSQSMKICLTEYGAAADACTSMVLACCLAGDLSSWLRAYSVNNTIRFHSVR